jgi:hypothetical protein
MSKRDNSKRSRLRRQRLREAEAELGPDHSEIVHELEDGWTIRRPRSIADLLREGELLSNCLRDISDGLPDDQDPAEFSLDESVEWSHTHSLRDPDNFPRAVFIHDASGHSWPWRAGYTCDLRGYGNTRVKDEYLERIEEWHATLPYPASLELLYASAA